MNRDSFRHSLLGAFALAIVGACSHGGDAAPQPPPVSPPHVATSSASEAPSVASAESPEPEDAPTEPFRDGARAFDIAKRALLARSYATGLTEDDVYRAAVRGMLEYSDPKMHAWNKLLGPRELAALMSDLKGEIVGVGARVDFDAATGRAAVLGVLPGSPAEKGGILPGDTIVSVDGKLYKGKALRDVLADLRGKAGEPVTLVVLRDDKLLPFTLTRQVVALDEVSHALLRDGIGYVRIHAFSAKTLPLLRSALADLAAKNARALVLDLRENHGGAFDDALASAEELLPAGTGIVTVRHRGGKDEAFTSKGAPVLAQVPVAVLVDHETSSSAELLTAALQEGRHARVIGARTFGKWSVQTVEELSNGYAMKYTVSMFRSPAGRSFEGQGLAPDVEVDMPKEEVERALASSDPATQAAIDPQLRTALALVTP